MFIYCICTQYLVGAPFALLLLPQFGVAWRWSVVALLRWYGSPGFFDSGLQLICIFWSLFLISSWQYPIGLVSLLASQAHQHHGHLTNFCAFGSVGQVPNPAGKWNQHLLKSWSAEGAWSASKFLVNGCSDVGFQIKHGPTPADDIAPPNHHRLWKRNTGLMQLGLWASPPFLQTLGPGSKWNTKLALIWKEDFGPLGNSPVLLLLSPGKTPLTLSVVQSA